MTESSLMSSRTTSPAFLSDAASMTNCATSLGSSRLPPSCAPACAEPGGAAAPPAVCPSVYHAQARAPLFGRRPVHHGAAASLLPESAQGFLRFLHTVSDDTQNIHG